MKLITRKGGVRLGILGVVLAVGLSWAYLTMIRMPLKSFAGNLPPLTPAQNALSERLRRDVTVL